jgi:hypothetical protein
MSRNRVAFGAAVVFTTVIVSATALAAAAVLPTPGNYAGRTSEQKVCSVNFGKKGCKVTFKVADHGKRVIEFTAADGYNGMCNYTAEVPHIFQFLVKWSQMKVRSNESFTGTTKATEGPFTGTFRVKGRFSSGKAHGTITRVHHTCGSSASNPATSDYAETFAAKRT